MKNFTYRLVVKENTFYLYYLYETDNKLFFMSKTPVILYSYTEEELKEKIEKIKECLQYPIVKYEDILELNLNNVEIKRFE
jgi:hypothetical protein